MSTIPRDPAPDSTLAFLREGYDFAPNRCARLRTDIFEARIMFRRAVFISGPEAAREFYVPDRFTRQGAVPPTALLNLQDRGSAAMLDGAEHRRRKGMFMSLMRPESIARLLDLFEAEWRRHLERWEEERRIVLLHEARSILTRAACAWAGVPLHGDRDAQRRAEEFGAMIDGAGAVGPRAVLGLLRRSNTESWARRIVRRIRAGRGRAPEGSAAFVIATHRDERTKHLPVRYAAVELLNVLRPTVAVDRYVMYAALALEQHPAVRRALDPHDDASLERFVNEVRRFYPFFPAVGGRVLAEFEWRGHRFEEDDWVMLDLWGTMHDPRAFDAPQEFRPDRFLERAPGAFDLIPQGGGDHFAGHRCAGEWITIALMKRAVRLLTTAMRYDVPAQDLTIDHGRMPATPRSRFVMSNVRRA